MSEAPSAKEMRDAIDDARRGHRPHEYEGVALRAATVLQRVLDAQPVGPTQGLNHLAQDINQIARDHGFWEADRNLGEMLMLATSELSEALEEHRENRPALWHKHIPGCDLADHRAYGMPGDEPECTCTPKPEGVAVEIADCIIRCLDTMHSLGVDIDEVVAQKMAYNRGRPFKHGKAY